MLYTDVVSHKEKQERGVTHGIVNYERLLVPGVERLEDRCNIFPVPKEYVCEHSSEGQVGGDEIQSVRPGEPGRLREA